jgi:HK97 family phage major capsid protein
MPEVAISRNNAETLIPEQYISEIFKEDEVDSIFLKNAVRLPNMTTNQTRMSILNNLPIAYFNNAGAAANDTSYKRTSNIDWKDRFIDAEEISVIVPIPENVLNDVSRDVWAEVTPAIRTAIGSLIDGAIFFGTNAPNAWPADLFDGATSAGNNIVLGAGGGDLYDDLLGEGGLVALMEADGFIPNGFVGNVQFRSKLRGVRYDQGGGANTGMPIFNPNPASPSGYDLDGQTIEFQMNDSWVGTKAHLMAINWNKVVYSIRQDVTYKVLDQAVIQDPTDGSIVFNLAQQDMVALRVVFRMGWQVPNPVNLLRLIEANRYPASVLTPVNPS